MCQHRNKNISFDSPEVYELTQVTKEAIKWKIKRNHKKMFRQRIFS